MILEKRTTGILKAHLQSIDWNSIAFFFLIVIVLDSQVSLHILFHQNVTEVTPYSFLMSKHP
jgi:hypothetical protein